MLPIRAIFEVLRNAPDGATGASGGAAAATGDAAATGVNAGDEVTSVLTRQPGDVKPDDAATGDAAKGSGAEAPKQDDPADTVPEDGAYQYALPEGLTANPAIAEAMNPVFKEAGLTQRQVDTVVKAYGDLVVKDQTERASLVDGTLNGWLEAAKTDKEIGGSNWDATVAAGNRVLQKFGDDEIDAALQQTGAGVHPAVLRLFARIGAAIGDDTAAQGTRPTTPVASEDNWYGETTPAAKKR